MTEILAYASSSAGNCYRVTDGSTPLLLEAGIPIKEIKRHLNYCLHEIQGCLISHSHLDHAKAAGDLMKAGIPCYMTKPTAEALGVAGHRVQIIEPQKQMKIGTWTVLPFETQHDCDGSVGFLLANGEDKILFATDTYFVKYRFTGLTAVMVECNYAKDILEENAARNLLSESMRERLLQSHFSLDNVKEFLKANDLSKVEEIWLLHLSDRNSDEKRFKREIMELTGKVVHVAPRG